MTILSNASLFYLLLFCIEMALCRAPDPDSSALKELTGQILTEWGRRWRALKSEQGMCVSNSRGMWHKHFEGNLKVKDNLISSVWVRMTPWRNRLVLAGLSNSCISSSNRQNFSGFFFPSSFMLRFRHPGS